MKIWALLFNTISLQGNALSPSLFELSYPFKIEGIFLLPQVLVYRRNHIMRILGMRTDLWRMGRGIVLEEQNTASQFSSPLSCDFQAYPPQYARIICTVYSATLLKIINHDHPLTIPKDWGHHLPCWMNPLKFLRRGWARVLPLFALYFWLWVKVVNPCLILGYNSLDRFAVIIFIARQEIPKNIEPSPFLIIGQHSGHPSCWNLWHT